MFSVIKNGDRENYGVNYYIVDEYSELNDIPGAAPGSKAYVIDKTKNYIKSTNEAWDEYVSAIGGGVGDAVKFIGITSSIPTSSQVILNDGQTVVTAEQGDIVFVDPDVTDADTETAEYIWNGKSWQQLDGGSSNLFTKVTTDGRYVTDFETNSKLSVPDSERPTGLHVVYGYRSGSANPEWIPADTTKSGAQSGRLPMFHVPVVDSGNSVPQATIYVADPKGTYEAANKNYVDETLNTVVHIGTTPPTHTNTVLWLDISNNN